MKEIKSNMELYPTKNIERVTSHNTLQVSDQSKSQTHKHTNTQTHKRTIINIFIWFHFILVDSISLCGLWIRSLQKLNPNPNPKQNPNPTQIVEFIVNIQNVSKDFEQNSKVWTETFFVLLFEGEYWKIIFSDNLQTTNRDVHVFDHVPPYICNSPHKVVALLIWSYSIPPLRDKSPDTICTNSKVKCKSQ
jgi:hypothetical protein